MLYIRIRVELSREQGSETRQASSDEHLLK